MESALPAQLGKVVAAAVGLSRPHPHQLEQDLGRIPGVPGRELLSRRRQESALRAVGARPRHQHRRAARARNFRRSRISGSKSRRARATAIVIYALLESESVTGAYRFTVQPGVETLTDVDLTLFPRTEMRVVGIAPLTSMFLFDETNRGRLDDYRPEVHDSDGLQIAAESGEQIFRQLANPDQAAGIHLHHPAAAGLRAGAALASAKRLSGFRRAVRAAAQRLGRTEGRLGPRLRRTGGDSLRAREQRQHRGLLAPRATLADDPPGAIRIPHHLERRTRAAQGPGRRPSPRAPAPASTASGACFCWISSAPARRSTACAST